MSQPTSPVRILVVDDEDEVRLSLRRMLESAGYEVLEASDGQEAMKVCRSRPLDLV